MTPARPWLVAVTALAACGAADAAPPDRPAADRAIRARAILVRYCGACHGETDTAGRLAVFDHARLTAHARPVPFVSKDRPLLVDLIEDGVMPPGDRPRPTEAEVKVLRDWAAAGAPAYPPRFGDPSAAEAVLKDFETVPLGARPFTRYVSLAHLVPPSGDPAPVRAAEQELTDALPPAARPEPIDPTATAFRFDIRDAGWHHKDLFVNSERVTEHPPVVPFDLILLENPHPVAVPDRLAGRAAEAVTEMTKPRDKDKPNPFRPPLFLKGDWLAAALRAGGKPTPLADDLAALAELGATPEADRADRKGPPFRPFAGSSSASFFDSSPALGSWASGDEQRRGDLKLDVTVEAPAVIRRGDTVKLVATADRDAHLAMLTVFPATERSEGQVLRFPFPDGTKLTGGRPTPVSALTDGTLKVMAASGTVRYVVFASDKPLPLTVVRSVHDKNPVWRFIPEDPTVAAVRKVISLQVTK